MLSIDCEAHVSILGTSDGVRGKEISWAQSKWILLSCEVRAYSEGSMIFRLPGFANEARGRE